MEIKNATITSVSLGKEDHGIPTCFVQLDYGDCGVQSFGGWDLRYYGIDFIVQLLDTIGVREWNDLVGKNVRAKCEHIKVHAIGHIIKNQWFEPEIDLQKKE